MKFKLFAASSVFIAVGLCGATSAQESKASDLSTIFASAQSSQVGDVEHNDRDISGTGADRQFSNLIDSNAFTDAEGPLNIQQSTGDNSVQQSSNTLAEVLNCNCGSGVVDLGAVSVGRQLALVRGNRVDLKGEIANSASSNLIGDFANANGLFNIQQNTGNNSIQQSSNTSALIVGR